MSLAAGQWRNDLIQHSSARNAGTMRRQNLVLRDAEHDADEGSTAQCVVAR
jgi:hypothetical protein